MAVAHHAGIVTFRTERVEERNETLGAEIPPRPAQCVETQHGRIVVTGLVEFVTDDDTEFGEVLIAPVLRCIVQDQ
jgi:hypothetical protein